MGERTKATTIFLVRTVAVALIAIGIIWILQGINVLPGSFMTGHIEWAYRGGFAALLGVAFLFAAGRRH